MEKTNVFIVLKQMNEPMLVLWWTFFCTRESLHHFSMDLEMVFGFTKKLLFDNKFHIMNILIPFLLLKFRPLFASIRK